MKYSWFESLLFKIKKHKNFCFVIFILFIVSVGYLIGVLTERNKYKNFLQGFQTLRENTSRYSLINPLIGNITPPATEVGIYSDIKEDVEAYLKKESLKGNLYGYSFYFRDLNSGLWFGSNESANFFPASLFKLPIAIATYKQGEHDSSFLGKRFIYTEELFKKNKELALNSDTKLVVGNSYSAEELVSLMLVDSDNGAKDLLLNIVDSKYIDHIFETASMIEPNLMKTFDISSRKYALFLRVLYGSSYLDEEHSSFIMELLTRSTFRDGLVAGLPSDVITAHKFGAYQFEENINNNNVLVQQLHDCGIVYHKNDPYLICFMTKGKNSDVLYNIISHVSSLVYNYQDDIDE